MFIWQLLWVLSLFVQNMILGTLEGSLYLYKVEVGKGQEIIEANPEQLI